MSRSTSASPIVVELSVSYEHLETNVRYALVLLNVVQTTMELDQLTWCYSLRELYRCGN